METNFKAINAFNADLCHDFNVKMPPSSEKTTSLYLSSLQLVGASTSWFVSILLFQSLLLLFQQIKLIDYRFNLIIKFFKNN